MPQGYGWYVFAVENGVERQLHDAEDEIVNRLRFGKNWNSSFSCLLRGKFSITSSGCFIPSGVILTIGWSRFTLFGFDLRLGSTCPAKIAFQGLLDTLGSYLVTKF